MKQNDLKPRFKMSYAALNQLGDKAVSLINRDMDELAAYGVNEAMKTRIIQKTSELKDLPTDEELLSNVSIITADKNQLADSIRNVIRAITVRAKNVFGDRSPQYKHFGIKRLDKMSDNDLYRCAKRVARTAAMYLTELSEKGLTEAEITELTNMATDFDNTIDEKDDTVIMRDIATEERLYLSNELYTLISEVFDYGKSYWYTREEAKYNDYVIYDFIQTGSKSINSMSDSNETEDSKAN